VKRLAFILLVVAAVVGAGALITGGAYVAWQWRVAENTYFTDGDTIRQPAGGAAVRNILWTPAEPLDGLLNTGDDDYEPRISADGRTMFFVRGKAGENADIWTATKTLDGWSEPVRFDAANSEHDELGPAPTRTGDAVYFYSDRPGGLGGYDLWVVSRGEDGWREPANLGPAVNSPFNDYGVAVSPDGATLYFASNRPPPTPEGDEAQPDEDTWTATLREDLYANDYDLYSSAITGAGYAPAQPLDALNTPHHDGSPAISPVGDFLYFASNRPGGSGAFDLYRSRILRGEILQPENLGESINTPRNELDPALAVRGFGIYFSSDRRLAESAPPDARDYNLYYAESREVFEEVDDDAAGFDWAGMWDALWPSLLWLLLLLLLLLALLALLRRMEVKRLGLLAKCLLASLLIHLLIMLLLTVWAVSTSISDYLREAGGTKVALAPPTGSDSNDLAAQIRGQLTEVTLQPPRETVAEQQATQQPLLRPMPVMTSLTVAESRIESEAAPKFETHYDEARPEDEPPPAPDTPDVELEPVDAPSLKTPREPAPARNEAGEQRLAEVEPAAAPMTERQTTEVFMTPARINDVADLPPVDAPAIDIPSSSALSDATQEAESTAEAPLAIPQSPEFDVVAETPAATDLTTPQSTPAEPTATSEQVVEIASSSITQSDSGSPARSETLHPAPVDADVTDARLEPTERRDDVEAETTLASDPTASAAETTPDDEAAEVARPLETPVDVVAALPEATEMGLPASDEASADTAPEETMSVRADAVDSSESAAADRSQRPMEVAESALPDAEFAPERIDLPSDADALADSMTPDTVEARVVDRALDLPGDEAGAAPNPEAPAFDADLSTLSGAETDVAAAESAEPSLEVNAPADAPETSTRRAEAQPSPESPDGAPSDVAFAPESTPDETSTLDAPLAEATDSEIDPAEVSDAVATVEPATDADAMLTNLAEAPLQVEGLALPSERVLAENPLAQRSEEARRSRLEEMGGGEETESAVADALRWLAEHQAPDGRWDGDGFNSACNCPDATMSDVDAALTGLSLLAFLGADHTHTNGSTYSDTVQRGLDWLVDHQTSAGSLMGEETMYSHGIATIALCEAFAMTGDPALLVPAERAVAFILDAANEEVGGWRYAPGQVGDTSVTGWQVMALASATRASIDIPDDALDHVRRWMDMVRHPRQRGRYAYQPGRQYTRAMTAEGMFVRQLLGVSRNDADMRASAEFLAENLPDWEEDPNTYYWYYGTLAMFHHQGPDWERWNDALKRELLDHQRARGHAAGSWDPADQWSKIGGRVYQTAISALCLEVYYRYLPLYSAEQIVDAVGTIRGTVTDAETGEALAGALVHLDLPDRAPITTRTDDLGRYEIDSPEMPEFFAVSASKPGYSPATITAAAEELHGRVLERDFELSPLREDVIALEAQPEVHHLGNDRHTGRINSQFQRTSEGARYEASFTVAAAQLRPFFNRAEVWMLCKGVQSPNRIRINGELLDRRLDDSPRDGSYGEFSARFDVSLLREGENTIVIQSVNDLGDLDDFEFVNVQIRLSHE